MCRFEMLNRSIEITRLHASEPESCMSPAVVLILLQRSFELLLRIGNIAAFQCREAHLLFFRFMGLVLGLRHLSPHARDSRSQVRIGVAAQIAFCRGSERCVVLFP